MHRTIILLLALFAINAAAKTPFTRNEDVIYSRKFGTALTMDVFQPEKTNGYAIVFAVSGGWVSAHQLIAPAMYEPFLKSGYTVFAVVHGSQPKFQIPEVIDDMHRAVRFIRFNAKKYGIDPNHIGVSGGSAGGHLSLILGTKGAKGADTAADPIDRESSAVQAVACFFPPTDFNNYGKEGALVFDLDVLKPFMVAFGNRAKGKDRDAYAKEISPVYFISSNQAPALIIHGDADKLVPIQQAETFVTRSKEAGAQAKLIVRKGEAHGWKDWTSDFALFVEWFDEHLRGIQPANSTNKAAAAN